MSQSPPEGQRSVQPPVVVQARRQPPPSQIASQPSRPVHAISDPIPTWNEHAAALVQLAVQPAPHAAVHPPAPVQATAHSSPHVVVHASAPVHEQLAATQRHPSPPPPLLHSGGPPGLGAPPSHAVRDTAIAKTREAARGMPHRNRSATRIAKESARACYSRAS